MTEKDMIEQELRKEIERLNGVIDIQEKQIIELRLEVFRLQCEAVDNEISVKESRDVSDFV